MPESETVIFHHAKFLKTSSDKCGVGYRAYMSGIPVSSRTIGKRYDWTEVTSNFFAFFHIFIYTFKQSSYTVKNSISVHGFVETQENEWYKKCVTIATDVIEHKHAR